MVVFKSPVFRTKADIIHVPDVTGSLPEKSSPAKVVQQNIEEREPTTESSESSDKASKMPQNIFSAIPRSESDMKRVMIHHVPEEDFLKEHKTNNTHRNSSNKSMTYEDFFNHSSERVSGQLLWHLGEDQSKWSGKNVGVLFQDNSASMITLMLNLFRLPVCVCPFSPKAGAADLEFELDNLRNFAMFIVDSRYFDPSISGHQESWPFIQHLLNDPNPVYPLAKVLLLAARKLHIPLVLVDSSNEEKTGMFTLDRCLGTIGLAKRDCSRKIEFKSPGLNDICLRLHTSGSTKRPKVVPLTHGNLLACCEHVGRVLRISRYDVAFNCMPLFHIHGLAVNMLTTILNGGSVVPLPVFEPKRFFDVIYWIFRCYHYDDSKIYDILECILKF